MQYATTWICIVHTVAHWQSLKVPSDIKRQQCDWVQQPRGFFCSPFFCRFCHSSEKHRRRPSCRRRIIQRSISIPFCHLSHWEVLKLRRSRPQSLSQSTCHKPGFPDTFLLYWVWLKEIALPVQQRSWWTWLLQFWRVQDTFATGNYDWPKKERRKRGE